MEKELLELHNNTEKSLDMKIQDIENHLSCSYPNGIQEAADSENRFDQEDQEDSMAGFRGWLAIGNCAPTANARPKVNRQTNIWIGAPPGFIAMAARTYFKNQGSARHSMEMARASTASARFAGASGREVFAFCLKTSS